MLHMKGLECLQDFRNGAISDVDFLRFVMKALFRPSHTVASYLKSLFPPEMKKNGYISIHARTGLDFGETLAKVRFSGNHTQYSSIAKQFVLCAKGEGLKWGDWLFFASDSSPLKSEMVNLAQQHNIKLVFSDIPAIHVGRTIPSWLRSSNTSVMNSFLNVFADFFAIAGGKIVISNKSEFSRLAYIFGNAQSLKSVNLSSDGTTCKFLWICCHWKLFIKVKQRWRVNKGLTFDLLYDLAYQWFDTTDYVFRVKLNYYVHVRGPAPHMCDLHDYFHFTVTGVQSNIKSSLFHFPFSGYCSNTY